MALLGMPPLHPSDVLSQLTSCSSLRLGSFPVLMNSIPSTAPVVLKAQQDPHDLWFLTGVTAPVTRWDITGQIVSRG